MVYLSFCLKCMYTNGVNENRIWPVARLYSALWHIHSPCWESMQIPNHSSILWSICIHRSAPNRCAGPSPVMRRRATTATPSSWPSCRPSATPTWARPPAARPPSVSSALFQGRRQRASTSRCIAKSAGAASTSIASSLKTAVSQHPQLLQVPTPQTRAMALAAAKRSQKKDTPAAVLQDLPTARGPRSAPSKSN